jgi:CrcB protein
LAEDPSDGQRRAALEPIDPDLAPPRPFVSAEFVTLVVIMAGGIIGAVGRYEAGVWWPTRSAGFPWTTLGINLVGSVLLPVVVVLATDVWPRRRLLRPLLGTGIIGGFTTFSTFAVDQERLFEHGHAAIAVAYLAATLVLCTVATWLSAQAARTLVQRGRI